MGHTTISHHSRCAAPHHDLSSPQLLYVTDTYKQRVVTLTEQERFDRGLRTLEEVNKAGIEKLMELLDPIAPDLARYVIEFAFGDVYTRPGLDARQRELCIISALAALGGKEELLKDHIEAAINVGCTNVEVVETLIMMAVYAGFPAAITAIKSAKEVLCE